MMPSPIAGRKLRSTARRRHRYADVLRDRQRHRDQLTNADQTTGDSVAIANFENVNASIFTTALTVTGSSVANSITTGSGDDTIDGGGGADVIAAGSGNDTVSYYGTETSVDGGTGTNTLILNTSAVLNLANANQLSFGAGTISNFQNVNASAVSAAVSITGSSGANVITGGSGNDTIDGAGGADTLAAGAGNDTVSYYGTEVSVDGGTGTNTLILKAATTVNLGSADQTSGDSVNVHELPERRWFGGILLDVDHGLVRDQHDHRGLRRRYGGWRRRRRRHQCGRRQRYRHLSRV